MGIFERDHGRCNIERLLRLRPRPCHVGNSSARAGAITAIDFGRVADISICRYRSAGSDSVEPEFWASDVSDGQTGNCFYTPWNVSRGVDLIPWFWGTHSGAPIRK